MKLNDLKQHGKANPNKGTLRGKTAVERSLTDCGAGRSVVVDRNGVLLAGNKTAEAAKSAGLDEEVILVPTDGKQLVVVQRTDLDANDPKAKELSVADNRTAELGLEWNADVLKDLSAEIDLKPYFFEHEMPGADIAARANDPAAEYVGMPEYISNKVAARDIIVHFKSQKDAQDFADLIGQTITDKTKYIWFPAEAPVALSEHKYE